MVKKLNTIMETNQARQTSITDTYGAHRVLEAMNFKVVSRKLLL